jgi:uncharacterized protein
VPLTRTLARTVATASRLFPVVLLTGPRQVGKTTLLQSCADVSRRFVTLDDLALRALARSDPALFIQRFAPPVTIDEIQYAPELLSAIKLAVDQDRQPGAFWLTGSQKFHLMQCVSESLAGRVAVLDLLGFSRAELLQRPDDIAAFLPTPDWIAAARARAEPPLTLTALYQAIWVGGFPQFALSDGTSRDLFYRSYVQTYIERDVRDLAKVGDNLAFSRFLRAAAARTGQLVNYADLARDVDIDLKTAKAWLAILEASGLVMLLQPYSSNVTNRLVKTPKLYFLDTGLCAYLTQWNSPEALEAGAMAGAIFETYVIGEILKSYWHRGLSPAVYFYRDRDGREIDLLIDQDGQLFPVEIKKTAQPTRSAVRAFDALAGLPSKTGPGALFCLAPTDMPLRAGVSAIPIGYL